MTVSDLAQSTIDPLAGTVQAFFSALLSPITRSIDAMALDLSKLTLDVATLHKLALDQHDLLATLRAQLDTALAAVKALPDNTAADAATQAALDAIDATVRDAAARLAGTEAPASPVPPIVTSTPTPAPSGAPTGVQVAL